MYDIESSMDNQIIGAMQNKPAVIFTEASDPRILQDACFLTRFSLLVVLASE